MFAISSEGNSLIVVAAATAASDKCSAIWRNNDPHYEALLLDDRARLTKTKGRTIVAIVRALADNGQETTTLSTS